MNATSLHTAVLLGSLTWLLAGCTAPTGNHTAPPLHSHPALLSSGALNSSGATAAEAASPSSAGATLSLHADPQKSITQVGFVDAAHSAACTSGCCPSATTHQGDWGSAAWLRAHGGACVPAAPHGYALPASQPWNLYGVDPQEFVCDGGDHPPPARVRHDDSLAGLQPEDTVVHYTTEAGDIRIQPSNSTCVYSPRFAAVRRISSAVAGERVIGLSGIAQPVGPNRFEHQLPGLVVRDSSELGYAEVTRRPDAMRDRNRGVRIEGVIQPLMADETMVILAALAAQDLGQLRDTDLALIERLANAAVAWTIDESVEVAIEDLKAATLVRDRKVEALMTFEFPDAGRLQIIKLADRAHAQPGEKVSFLIRIQNVGDSPVNHVVLTDNLTTRLEYVEGSQQCSVEADFATEVNQAQSLQLQWKLQEELAVGDVVEIHFECLLR